jgi:two-component system LytT family response regulator
MLRTMIVDDEAPARERLARLLEPAAAAGRVRLVGEAADGLEALRAIGEGGVDLALLDVQMPGLTGFEVLERLPPDARPAVVFVTAYDQYALRAFEVAAVDYLVKPVEPERLAAALARVERQAARGGDGRRAGEDRLAELLEYLDREHVAERPPPERPAAARADYLRQLSIPGRDRLLVVPVDDLLAAEVQEGITRLYTLGAAEGGRAGVHRHLVGYPLETLEARLDPEAFVRVHRAALVQVRHIREMIPWFSGRYKLVLSGGHEVIASRTRSRELRDRLSL